MEHTHFFTKWVFRADMGTCFFTKQVSKAGIPTRFLGKQVCSTLSIPAFQKKKFRPTPTIFTVPEGPVPLVVIIAFDGF
jgi:hypothetical protein